MAKVITFDDMVLLMKLNPTPATKALLHKLDCLGKAMAEVIAEHYSVRISSIASTNTLGTVVCFRPMVVGDICPDDIHLCDPGGKWEA